MPRRRDDAGGDGPAGGPGPRPTPEVIPLTVLTGFLGSGKTTLLNRLLADEAMAETAVIVNEFGEVGLDHLLVETADEGVVEMSSGCLCCTIRGDLINTLEDLLRRRDNGRIAPFRRVLIETTGLADPAPVLHTIMNHPYLVLRYRLDAVVTTVDAVNGEATLDAHAESVKQAAVADRIVVTKADLCGGRVPDALGARLAALNPAAPVLDAAAGEATAGSLFGAGLFDEATKTADVRRWLREEAYGDGHSHGHDHARDHDVNRHDARIRAFCLSSDRAIGVNSFNLFCELLRSAYGASLLRVKGVVLLDDEPGRPVVVHGVQHVFHPPVRLESWPDGDRRTRIVFIVRDLEKDQLEELFNAFAEPVAGAEARAAWEARDALSLAPGAGFFRK